MREKLALIEGYRGLFLATFQRFGGKPGWQGQYLKTVLLVKITDDRGDEMCDHVWFDCGKQFEELGLKSGDRIAFRARVQRYVKGYHGGRDGDSEPSTDFRIAFPTDVRRVVPAGEDMPLFNENAQAG